MLRLTDSHAPVPNTARLAKRMAKYHSVSRNPMERTLTSRPFPARCNRIRVRYEAACAVPVIDLVAEKFDKGVERVVLNHLIESPQCVDDGGSQNDRAWTSDQELKQTVFGMGQRNSAVGALD